MMRIGHRGRGRLAQSVVLAVGVALACAGCAVNGKATATPVPVQTAGLVARQAITDLSEAGVLHYQGTLTTASNDAMTIDLLVTSAGEATGTATLDGQQAQVADLSGTLYINASQAFWTTLADLPAGSTSAAAGNWVTVPTDVLGVDPDTGLAPQRLGASLTADFSGDDTTPLAKLLAASSGNQIEFGGTGATIDVTRTDPHGITHVKMALPDGDQLSVGVTDATTTEAAVYQTLVRRASQSQVTVDPDLTIQEGNQSWGSCDASSCSVVVTFTNTSSVQTKVLISGNWTGDNNPVGTCQVITDPVAPGTAGTATCTVNSPQWVAFYHQAQTVPGSHPYELRWSALALSPAPDQQTVSTEATEAAKPASKSTPTGRDAAKDVYHVYLISYQDHNRRPQVWKYGVNTGGSWRKDADGQLSSCRAENKTSCLASLIASADNRPSADALVDQLVATATAADGRHCPPGQWVSCG